MLYCIVLNCIVLYYAILYCIKLMEIAEHVKVYETI